MYSRAASRSTDAGAALLPCFERIRASMLSRALTSHQSCLSQSRHVQARCGRVLMRPARCDHFGTRVELDALDTVHVEVAEQRILPAAEGKESDRNRDRHVHPDHADLYLVLEAAGSSTRLGEYRRAVGIWIAVDQRDRILEGFRPQHDEHRTEDLIAINLHFGRDIVEKRRAEKKTFLVVRDRLIAAVDDQFRAFVDTLVHVALCFVAMLGGNERPHLDTFLLPWADYDCFRFLLEQRYQRVRRRSDGNDGGDRHAALPR